MKITRSFKDSRGHQWIACCECNRGGNGNDKDKCSAGGRSKKWDQQGCFIGEAMLKSENEQ